MFSTSPEYNISTLPCETWNVHCTRATIELLQSKLKNVSHLQIRQIWIQLITPCGKYCKRRCTKHA